MTQSAQRFHLGWFLDGFRVPSWNREWSGTSDTAWLDGSFYVDFARTLERGCFDYLMIEDNNYVPDVYGGTMDVYLKWGQRAPKHDPTILAALVGAATRDLGVIATVATSEVEPFRLARLMQTLDHTTHGRIGWNVVTGSNDRAAQNFGHEGQASHDERYDMADDFIAAARALWDSWQDDAFVMDKDSGVYVDAGRVTVPEYVGKYYRTRGPLNSIPGPQRHPVLVQAGVSPRGQRFSARHADTIIATGSSLAEMKQLRLNIREHAAQHGRDPDDIKVMFMAEPILADTDAMARAKSELAVEERDRFIDFGLSSLASVTTTDFSEFDLDQPLPRDLTTNGHQGQLNDMVSSQRPLRELAVGAWAGADEAELVGTPETVAEKMAWMMSEIGGDGFLLTSLTPTRRYLDEIVDGLVPALQRRGLVRDEYTRKTLREHLHEF
jgi:FMN-dependent oxidoreductase (nitrilotriacetate monooxygenase family)